MNYYKIPLYVALAYISTPVINAEALVETFDYTNNTILVNSDTAGAAGTGGWHRQVGGGGGNGNKITVNDGVVSFGANNGQDIFLSLDDLDYDIPTASENDVIYVGFDFSISSTTATGDTFIGLGENQGHVRAQIRARSSGSGYVLGYAGLSTSTWDNTVLDFDEPYRAVFRYNLIPGSNNNSGTIYVFPYDLTGVDSTTESNNTPLISAHVLGGSNTDWDTSVTGIILNQSSNSPDVSFFDNLFIADNFTEALTDEEPSEPSVIISEDFSSSPVDFTVIAGGTWSVTGGRYVLSNPGNAANGLLGNISVHDTETTGDLQISTLIRITGTSSAWDDAAVIFNYQDEDNFYYVSLNESNDSYTKGIFKVQNGSPTELTDIGYAIASNTDYTLEIERSGSSITVFLNSSQIATTTDSTFNSGKVGYGSKNDGAQYDNLIVYGSTGSPPPQQVASPSFNPAGGTYTSSQSVTITTATSGATIRYTTNGSNPTSSSGTIYSGPVAITSTTTLKAIAYKSGSDDSSVTSATYTINSGGGGGFPSESNTGWQHTGVTLTPMSGTVTITTDNYVLDSVDITGVLRINANNVTVKRSRVRGSGGSTAVILVQSGKTGAQIIDVEIDGLGSSANGIVTRTNATVLRCDIQNCSDGIRPDDYTLIQDNYIFLQDPPVGAHSDGIQTYGANYVDIIHNYIDIGTVRVNGCIFIDNGSHHITAEDNLLNGGAYAFRGGSTYAVVLNNTFGQKYTSVSGLYGAVNGFNPSGTGNQWSGNVFEGGGTVAP